MNATLEKINDILLDVSQDELLRMLVDVRQRKTDLIEEKAQICQQITLVEEKEKLLVILTAYRRTIVGASGV